MKKKQVAGMGLLIPKKMRIGGMTFYKRQGQVIGRVSESMEKRSNTLPQFKQRRARGRRVPHVRRASWGQGSGTGNSVHTR